MRLNRMARFKIRWTLAIAGCVFFLLHPVSIVFWVLFWVTAGVFLLSGDLWDLMFPLDPDDEP